MARIETITASQLEYLQDNYEYVTVDLGRQKAYAYVLEDIRQFGEVQDMGLTPHHIERRPGADLWNDNGWCYCGLNIATFFDPERYTILSSREDAERYAKEYLRDCTESVEYDMYQLSTIAASLSDMVEKAVELNDGQYICFDILNNDFDIFNKHDVYHIDTHSHTHRIAVIVDVVEEEEEDQDEEY